MAGFDVSFLNKNLKKKQDFSFVVDQLSIKENQLASDGKLSPGDYNLLIGEAQKIRAFPGLTPANRSKVDVKISQYQESSRVDKLTETQDINRMNRDLKEDFRTTGMLFGNDPQTLMQSRSDALRAKLDILTDAVDQRRLAGKDATVHESEFNITLGEYNDILTALEDSNAYGGSGEPESGFVAHVTTNDGGEIVDVDIARVGTKSGYVETNGVYGGLKIYGKVNKKQGGKNIFVIGGETFSAADVLQPDPNNPLGFRSNPLLSESAKRQFGLAKVGQAGQFQTVDLATVRTQSHIPEGHFAEGIDGFLYERLPGGKYKKYVGIDKEKKNIPDNRIMRVPRSMEENIMRDVVETVDSTGLFIPDAPSAVTPVTEESVPGRQIGPVAPTTIPAPTAPQVPAGRGRTAGPTPTSPATQQNIFQRTFQSAKGFLGSLFGQ